MMLPFKRKLAAGMFAALGMLGLAGGALAQGELKIIAPAAPGGGWDQTARAMQAALTASGAAKSAQVVNVPGAGGTVGLAQFVNSAKGDGSQLLVNGLVMVGAILTNKAPVTLDMVTPIARLTGEFLAVVVPANSPVKDAKELGAALKADPAKVTFAGGSAGGVDHMFMGLFAKAVGADTTKINYIPFSGGGEALAAILGGKVTAGVSGYSEFEGQIKSGKLRLLAITSPKRLPNVDGPTLKEQGIDLDIINWRSVFAAPGITPEQRAALQATIDKMVKSPAWTETLKTKGWDDAYLPGDEFAAFLKEEQTRVSAVLASIGLTK
jgi:putative tricarboxylic transport membrane protein